jgi:hypothetical protein
MTDRFPLKKAVDAWCRNRIDVYRASADDIWMNATSAAAVTKDHVDRWLFELIQNAEDAGATRAKLVIGDAAIYLADNGGGLAASAVRSISSLHLSEKPAQAIGRKGLGFKAVYCVSAEPAVFSGDEGVWFCEGRARQYLAEHGFGEVAKVPFTWLPIWLSRTEAAATDEALAKLSDFTTVVRMPLRERAMAARCLAQARTLSAETLLTFRHLSHVEIESGAVNWRVGVAPDTEKVWELLQGSTERRWSVAEKEWIAPAEVLTEFVDAADRARCERVTCLVAALLDANGIPSRFRPPPRLHVFYPTDVAGPLDILLHAEFVAKSDRTAIVPFDGSAFNAWLADVLAQEVIEFAQKAATPQRPEAGLLLIAPTVQSGDESTVTGQLWAKIRGAANRGLRIANSAGDCGLQVSEAVALASDLPGRVVARRLLAASELGRRLVHEGIEQAAAATDALVKLGGTKLSSEEVVHQVGMLLAKRETSDELRWSALEWVAEYRSVGESHWSSDPLAERTRDWQMIVLETEVISFRELGGRSVTWRDESLLNKLPEWLPMRCLSVDFRARLEAAGPQSAVRKFLGEHGLKVPSRELVIEALENAVKEFWDNSGTAPERFLDFLAEADFGTELLSKRKGLSQCPVQVIRSGGLQWAKAERCYFGSEWGNDLLVRAYDGIKVVVT